MPECSGCNPSNLDAATPTNRLKGHVLSWVWQYCDHAYILTPGFVIIYKLYIHIYTTILSLSLSLLTYTPVMYGVCVAVFLRSTKGITHKKVHIHCPLLRGKERGEWCQCFSLYLTFTVLQSTHTHTQYLVAVVDSGRPSTTSPGTRGRLVSASPTLTPTRPEKATHTHTHTLIINLQYIYKLKKESAQFIYFHHKSNE